MKRAMSTQTQPMGAEFEFQLGQNVDWYRDPPSKDMSGWRGPGVVADLSRLEHGRIGVRTSTDQVITCRLQDVRHSLSMWSEELSVYFGHPDYMSPGGSQANQAQQLVQQVVDDLRPGSVLTLGHIRTAEGRWVESAATQVNRSVLLASMFVAETVFQLCNVVAVRLARSIRTLTSREEFSSALTLWWCGHGSRQIHFLHSQGTKVATVELVGQAWPDLRIMQFLCVPDDEDWATTSRWSVPREPVTVSGQEEEERSLTAGSERLSTIPEESRASEVETASMPSWEEVCAMFGTVSPETFPFLSEAYTACQSEVGPGLPERDTYEALVQHVYTHLVPESGVDIPNWHEAQACHAEQSQQDSSYTVQAEMCDCDPESYVALDCDDQGAYVALEVYGDLCKCVEGLSRMPLIDEHVEVRMYETHSRKAVIERSDDLLTPEEIHDNASSVTQAILDELKTWQGYKCFRRRPRAESPCVIDVRWVYKWKFVKGERKIRARLCLRGFKETGADDQSNFSATASRFSQKTIVSECVLREWTIASSDVPKAFLQGVSYEELSQATQRPIRDVSFELTGEGLECLRMLPEFRGFNPRTEVLHCLKPGTGCRDAPKCFSLKLRQITEEFGMVSSVTDPEMELLFDNGALLMIVVKHVDDLKMAGQRALIEKFVQHLSRVFGKMDVEWSNFTFCGVQHVQHSDGSISLDQIKFLAACKTITHPRALSGASNSTLPEEGRRLFLSLLMTVAYALITRPDVAIFVVALQRESHKAQVQHVRKLNTLVKWLQANPRRITFPKMTYPDMLLQISDSSYKARAEDGLSVRGLVSVRVHSSAIKEGLRDTTCHLIDYASKAQRHVTRSTFSSELFAATDATDIGILHSTVLHELANGKLTPQVAKQLTEGSLSGTVKLGLVVDAKSVSSAVIAPHTKIPAEPSLLLHVCWLRALLMSGRLNELYWADTRAMIADALTKGSVSRELIAAVMGGTLLMPFPYEAQRINNSLEE